MADLAEPPQGGDDDNKGLRKALPALPAKLAHLAEVFGLDADKLATDLYMPFSHETVDKLRSGDDKHRYNQPIRQRLTEILGKLLPIPCKERWLTATLPDFEKSLRIAVNASMKTVSFDAGEPLGLFSVDEQRDLTGTWRIYRASFSNRPLIAREWLTIASSPAFKTRLECRMWCHPSGSKSDGNANIEDFGGPLIKFNDCYYLMTALKTPPPSVTTVALVKPVNPRLRILMFPIDPIHAHVHFGLATGRSLHLQSPVAARVVIHKTSGVPDPAPNLGLVDRIGLAAVATTDDPLLHHYAPLIDNHLGDQDHVLTATVPAKRNFLKD